MSNRSSAGPTPNEGRSLKPVDPTNFSADGRKFEHFLPAAAVVGSVFGFFARRRARRRAKIAAAVAAAAAAKAEKERLEEEKKGAAAEAEEETEPEEED